MNKNLSLTICGICIVAVGIGAYFLYTNKPNDRSFETQSVRLKSMQYNDQAVDRDTEKTEIVQPVCGNGVLEEGEQCDNGEWNGVEAKKAANGDYYYCDENCTKNFKYDCGGGGSVCSSRTECAKKSNSSEGCQGLKTEEIVAGSCQGYEPCPQLKNKQTCESVGSCKRNETSKTIVTPGKCACAILTVLPHPDTGKNICGNFKVNEGEECDVGVDGGFINGKYCSPECKILPEYSCYPEGVKDGPNKLPSETCNQNTDCVIGYCKKPQDTPKGLCSGLSPCPQITDEKSCKSISYCNRGSYDSSANQGICTCDGF